MHDDRVSGLVLRHRPGRGAALRTIAGILDCALIGTFTGRQTLDTNSQALVVHHGEHRRQALVRLADHPTGGTVEIHHAGCRGLDTHLVLDGTAGQRVSLTQGAILIDHDLWHQEQRDAAGASRRIRQFGQHQMDDVLGQVVLAAGDEDLGSANLVGTIGLWLSLGANDAQVGARMGLGQAHGAGPDTGIHVRQVLLLELLAGVGIDRQAGAGRQHWIETEGQAGGVHHFLDLSRDDFRHAHAAERRITTNTYPAAFGVQLISLAVAGGRRNRPGVPATALFITAAVKRGNAVGRDLAGFLKNGVGRFGIDNLGQGWQRLP